jgi:amidase
MNELWRWPAGDLAHAIRTRRISSREAVQACLARTHAVNSRLNAIVQLLEAEALAAADAADRAVARGDALAPLHGVPVTTKVNVDQTGLPTTNGVVAFRDLIARDDSPVVANLRQAGAVIFGRTNTPAFSFRWFTDNDLHGRTLNPWSKDHTPGGSSGGASSAVAAGMGPIAHGNDLAGSVRFPAHCTGVFGLRPSFGRVPAFQPSATEERPLAVQFMSVQGPLARTVADIRLALQAMAAPDARDPWWVPAPLHGPAPQRPIRVAMTTSAAFMPAEPAVADTVRRAGQWLADAGYVVDEVEPPLMAEAAQLWDTLVHGEARVFMAAAIEKLGDDGIRRAFGGMTRKTPVLDAEGHMRAQARRTTLIRHWMSFMQRYPLVLTPVSAEPPFPWGLDVESLDGIDRVMRAQGTQFMVPLLGLPAISAPAGFVQGLPVGVQIIGARFREDLVMDAAEVIEGRHPPTTPIDPRF